MKPRIHIASYFTIITHRAAGGVCTKGWVGGGFGWMFGVQRVEGRVGRGGGSGIIERSEEWSCPGNTEQEEGRTTASVQLPCLLLLLCHNTVSVRR